MAGEIAGPAVNPTASGPTALGEASAWLVARRSWLAAAAAPLGAAAIALWLIVPTVLPDVASWDTAEFQTVLPLMGTAHPTGFPAYVILGWIASIVLLPFGSPAYRVDLLQAILAATAVGGAVAIVRQLGAPRVIAFAVGVVMATTLLFWRLSTHADPHMFHVALLALLFAVLLGWERRRRSADPELRRHADRWLIAATLVYGVAVANHSLALLLAPGIGLFVLLVEPGILLRWRFVATCVGVLAVTIVALFLELPVRAAMGAPLVYGRPDTWDGFWYVVLGAQFTGSLVQPFSNLGDKSWHVLSIFSTQLSWLIYVLPLGYLAAVYRRPQAAVLAGCAVVSAQLLLAPSATSDAIAAWDVTPFCIALGMATVLALRPRYGVLSGLALLVTCWFAMSYSNADIERYYLGPLLIVFTWIGLAIAEAVSVAAEVLTIPDWAGFAARVPAKIAEAWDAFGSPGALRAEMAAHAIAEVEPAPTPDRAVAEREARRQRRRREREAQGLAATAFPVLAILLLGLQSSVVIDRNRPVGGTQGPGVNESRRTGDRVWLDKVMTGLPENVVVLSWWSASTTLWYGRYAEGRRPDVLVSDDRNRLDTGPHSDDIMVGIAYYLNQGRRVFVIKPDKMDQIRSVYQVKPWFDQTVYEIVGPVRTP